MCGIKEKAAMYSMPAFSRLQEHKKAFSMELTLGRRIGGC